MPDSISDREHLARIHDVAGQLALGLADELARPLASVTELLASAVDKFDRHISSAKGPDPLSYDDSKAVREAVAEAYLKASLAARLLGDLATAVSRPEPVASADLNKLVDDAIGLCRHRFSATTEIFIDLGTIPTVPLIVGETLLALAALLIHCADSTRQLTEAAISVRTRLAQGGVLVTVAENGKSADDLEIARVTTIARGLVARLGGSFEAISSEGAGTTFELRLPVGSRP